MSIRKTFFFSKIIAICILFIVACSGGDDSPEPEEIVSLEKKYRGTWNSTTPSATFTNVAVSTILTPSATDSNKLLGEFFINANFTVCCSPGPNDGTLVLEVNGNTITSFLYNDFITDCSGSFNGTGVFRDDGGFVIDFTGNDCDGDHVGQLVLNKV